VGVFVAEIRPRWSDMDAFGHVNHANTVTLLEEARVDLLFVEATRHGAAGMAEGVVVARLVDDPVVATAETMLVPFDVQAGRPRRLSEQERDFLAAFRSNGA